MKIGEQEWAGYKDEFHSRVTDLLNYIQTISAEDISHVDVIKTLIDMRHKVTDAYLHVFNFVEDTNVLFLEKLLSGGPSGEKKSE